VIRCDKETGIDVDQRWLGGHASWQIHVGQLLALEVWMMVCALPTFLSNEVSSKASFGLVTNKQIRDQMVTNVS